MVEKTPEQLLRGWAKAYRDTPEHRFPSDPHAEFFPVDLEAAADEIKRMRKALKSIANSNLTPDRAMSAALQMRRIASEAINGPVGESAS
jgi:hypothetical protein